MKKIILILVGILILSCSKESNTKYITENELIKVASEFKIVKNTH